MRMGIDAVQIAIGRIPVGDDRFLAPPVRHVPFADAAFCLPFQGGNQFVERFDDLALLGLDRLVGLPLAQIVMDHGHLPGDRLERIAAGFLLARAEKLRREIEFLDELRAWASPAASAGAALATGHAYPPTASDATTNRPRNVNSLLMNHPFFSCRRSLRGAADRCLCEEIASTALIVRIARGADPSRRESFLGRRGACRSFRNSGGRSATAAA